MGNQRWAGPTKDMKEEFIITSEWEVSRQKDTFKSFGHDQEPHSREKNQE